MEAEAVLNLFDSYWFDLDLFQKNPSQNKKFPEMAPSNPEIPTLPTIHTKTPVFELISSDSPQKLSDSSASPNSVLLTPKLQTIFSGKISEEFEGYSRSEKETPENTTITTTTTSSKTSSPLKGNTGITNRRRKKKGLSKSLSDLEFEELKGFMDLGFVFSEEDKDSSLVSIIPGLQRLGNNNTNNINHNINTRNNNNNNNSNVDEITNNKVGRCTGKSEATSSISRPYLSEAWEVMEKKRRENSLLKWRVPDPNSQVQMKDNLRFWAHTVASTVL